MNHYKIHKPEPIELIQRYNLNFIEGNIVKYILRSPFKGDRIGDLNKALKYAIMLEIDREGIFPQFDFEKELKEYKQLNVFEKNLVALVINRPKSYSDKELLIEYIKMAIEDRSIYKESRTSSLNQYSVGFIL